MQAAAKGYIQVLVLLILARSRVSNAELNLIKGKCSYMEIKNHKDVSKIAKAGRESLIECNHIVPLV